jgi:hypothetical protein
MLQKSRQQPKLSLVRACDPPDVRSVLPRTFVNAINIQMRVEGDHETSNGAFD